TTSSQKSPARWGRPKIPEVMVRARGVCGDRGPDSRLPGHPPIGGLAPAEAEVEVVHVGCPSVERWLSVGGFCKEKRANARCGPGTKGLFLPKPAELNLPVRPKSPRTGLSNVRYRVPVDREDLVRLRRAKDQMDREYARPLDVEALARTAC